MDRNIADRAYDLFGALLLEKENNALLAELEAERADERKSEMDAFFAAHDKNILQRIDRYFRRQKTRRFFTKTLPLVGQIAAVLIIVIAISSGVSATNSTENFLALFKGAKPNYTIQEHPENNEAIFRLPVVWSGKRNPGLGTGGSFLLDSYSGDSDFFVPNGHCLRVCRANPHGRCLLITTSFDEEPA